MLIIIFRWIRQRKKPEILFLKIFFVIYIKPKPLRLILIISFGCIAQLAEGQVTQIDSLQRLIDLEGDTKRKVELLNQLSYAYFDLNVESASQSTRQALELSVKIQDTHGEAWALTYRGLYFFLNGILEEAQILLEESLSLAQTLKEYNLQVYALTQLGNVSRDQGNFAMAYQFYKKAEVIASTRNDSFYGSVLQMNIARYYLITHQPDSALQIVKSVLKIREKMKNSVLLADAWMLMGNCYRGKENFPEAEKYYQKAFPISKHDQIVTADYKQNMGEIYFRKGEFQKALENWSEVLTYQRKFQYKYALADLLWRMGTAFEQQGYYDLALEYLANALTISEKSGYQYLTGEILHEQSWVYYRTRNMELALANYKKAVKIFRSLHTDLEIAGCWDLRGLIERRKKNYDSSLFYHKKSLAERIRINNKVDISSSLFNTGEYFIDKKKFETALPYYFRGLAIDRALHDNYGTSLYLNRIGSIYTEQSRFDSAKFYLEASMKLAIPTSANEILRDNYLDFASYYEKLGKPVEAIRYYKRFNELSDSIFSKQTAQSLASYRTLYDVERSEQQINLLNKDNQLNRALVQKQKTILYSVITGSLVFLIVAVFYYRFSKRLRKLNREIAEQKEEIQAQAEELTENNQTIVGINEKLEERIEARTSELKQAFKELDTFFYRSSHDFRRPLTTFMGLAEVARVLVKDTTALELFEKVNENALNLDKMLRKLQSVSDVDMQTLIYKEVSLREIFEIELYDLRNELDNRKIRTTLSVKLDRPFHSYAALIRIIVQNLLENSIAFCAASSPVIHLSAYEKNNEVVIEVQDNGLGIEPEYVDRVFEMYLRANEHSKGNGLGLYIVKKTVQKLNGRIELQSELNKGTTVKVFFPHRAD